MVALPWIAASSVAGITIGIIAISSGAVAAYGGTAVVAGSGVQVLSGVTGYRLDGEQLTSEEAQQRIPSGIFNATTSI